MEQMNHTFFKKIAKLLTPALIVFCALIGLQAASFAEDHVLSLKIVWDQQQEKITVTRSGLTRAVGDQSRWVFKVELATDLEMVTGPTWHHETKVAQAAQDWGLWAPVQGDAFSYTFASPDQAGGTFRAWAEGRIRRKQKPGVPGGVVGGLAPPEIDFEANWLGDTGDISVVFEPDLIRTGFALDANDVADTSSPIGKVSVTATVTPKEATANINIVPGMGEGITDRVSIKNIVKNADTGIITFDLRGTSASKDQNGDSLVAAKKIDDGKVVGTAKV